MAVRICFETQRGPARTDNARSDVGDAVNGLGVGHVISLMRLLDFGIGDAGEIALGVKVRERLGACPSSCVCAR
jgi:hypothetical protein